MAPQLSLDDNTQKTHYSIDLSRCKRQKTGPSKVNDNNNDINNKNNNEVQKSEKTPNTETAVNHNTPLLALPGETASHVKLRYLLYEKIWGHQKQAIESILNSANNALFADLLSYIQDPISDRLDTAFLALSSNTANNLRLLDEFSSYVADDSRECAHVRMVRLNSKTCFNIKAAVREMIKQIVEGSTSDSRLDEVTPADDEDEDEENIKDNDANPDSDNDNDNDIEIEVEDEDVEEDSAGFTGGRISYDFEIVQDWMDSYVKKFKCEDSLRIVVVLDDSDGFSNEVLNQLLQLICIYTSRYPIKMIMALSSRNVGDWINSNITSKLRTLIESVKLEAKDNKDIGFQVIDDILLQNEITAENPFLLDAYLSSIILNRFQNSNNSIDSLITELKLSYMIYFYQSPLPVLVDSSFIPEKFHYDALRKLPSFKTHMEDLVHKLETNTENTDGSKIMRLLSSNKELKTLFDDSRKSIQKYQNAVMNAVNMIYWLCGGSTEKFQIYKLITNNQFMNSSFSSGILKKVSSYTEEEFEEYTSFMYGPFIKDSIGSEVDEDLVRLKEKIGTSEAHDLKEIITEYFHSNKHLNMKISDNLFNEVLTINGGRSELDELKPPVSIEENYENLMINLIRPNSRELIETALDEPQHHLRNPLIMERIGQKKKTSRLMGPPLCKLYQVYKDAPVSINLWDFYVAFKQSLAKQQIIAELDRHVQNLPDDAKAPFASLIESVKNSESEETWDKMTYGWFLQGCFELNAMGFLKEKVKGDYMEKLIWKNL